MQETLVACPVCHVSLRLNAAPGPRTKLRCPKCSAVFSPPDSVGPAHQETRVDELLSQWQKRQRLGDDVPAHELCKDCPELLPAVDARLWALRQMQHMALTLDGSSGATESIFLTGDAAPPPHSLGGYRVIKELGRGGMGMVYEAEDARLKRRVALKVMLPQHAADANARKRFLREAQTQAAIEHDHIVTIHQADEDQGIPFIAMPLLKGEALADCLARDGRLPPADVLRIGREAAEGLAAAHERGLIHRDIKPSNLWLEGKRRRIKILDFGLARAIEESSAHLTGSGVALGTPAYMAPEQARGDAVDARTDLFSLGCVLYQMTTGTLPFAGKSMLAIFNSLANTTPKPPHELVAGLPAGLSELIEQLLAKEPAQRPADAQAVAEALAALEQRALRAAPTVVTSLVSVTAMPPNDSGTVATPINEPAPATDSVSAEPQLPSRTPALRSDRRGPLIGIVVAAAALLAICGGGGGLLYQYIVIRNKDGEEIARIKAPKDKFEIEVNGKKIILPAPDRQPEPPKPSNPWQFIPIGQSPLDKLDANEIPREERFAWQPKELVAVIGKHARRSWWNLDSAAFSPDGSLVATGDNLGVVIWDFITQTPKAVIPSAWLYHFLPDGKRILVGRDNQIQIWDISGKEPALAALSGAANGKPLQSGESARFAALVEDGRSLCWGEHNLSIADLRSEAPAVTVMPVGGFLASGGTGWVVAAKSSQVFYVAKDKKVHRATIKSGRIDHDEILPIPFTEHGYLNAGTPDGSKLVVWADKELQVWDLSAKPPKIAHRITEQAGVRLGNTVLSADGRWLANKYSPTALFRLDAPEPKLVTWLDQTDSSGHYGAIAFSADGGKAIVANHNGLVRFWDLSAPEPKELAPFDPAATFVAPHPGGQGHTTTFDPRSGSLVVTRLDVQAGKRQQLQWWHLGASRPTPGPLLDSEYGRLCRAAGDRWLLITPWDGSVSHYRVAGNEVQQAGESFGPANVVGSVSSDGKRLILIPTKKPSHLEGWDIAGDTPKQQWQLTRKDLVFALGWGDGGTGPIWSSADNRWFATQARPAKEGDPRKLVLWRNTTATPEVHATLPITWGGYRAAFSPDGRYLVHTPASADEIVLLDLTGKTPREIGKFNDSAKVRMVEGDLAFHPDGKKVAVGSLAGVCIIDVPSLQPLWHWQSPGPVVWLDWAAAGRHLVTHNRNMTLYVLRFPTFAAGQAGGRQ